LTSPLDQGELDNQNGHYEPVGCNAPEIGKISFSAFHHPE